GRRQAQVGWTPALGCRPGHRQTVTSSRSSAKRTSPMSEISRNWSTEENPPLTSRQARMRCASAGPIPGSVSRSVWVAVLRLTLAGAPARPPTSSGGGGTPTATSSPSASRRARLSWDRSASGSAPPAASTASATRAPGARRTSPGRCTSPVTATTISAGALGVAAGATVTTGDGGTGSTRGRDHQASAAAPATTTAATAASARTPGRPGSKAAPASRASTVEPAAPDRAASRSDTPKPATPGLVTAERSAPVAATPVPETPKPAAPRAVRVVPGGSGAGVPGSREEAEPEEPGTSTRVDPPTGADPTASAATGPPAASPAAVTSRIRINRCPDVGGGPETSVRRSRVGGRRSPAPGGPQTPGNARPSWTNAGPYTAGRLGRGHGLRPRPATPLWTVTAPVDTFPVTPSVW